MDDERAIVAAQLGREPRAFRRVVVRCPFGRPAVTEQSPYDDSGEPFPTTYYLTCPHLVAAVSSAGARTSATIPRSRVTSSGRRNASAPCAERSRKVPRGATAAGHLTSVSGGRETPRA